MFVVGFIAAATNPLTGSYFLTSSMPTGRTVVSWMVAPVIVTGMAFLFFMTVAAVLSSPVARRATVRWDRPVRIGAATLLAVMALRTAWPIVNLCVGDF